ncbi:6-phosphogluconolactonase [Enhydrobacter aerosaccus]|uniref:6-phosphogluconolactonase n=1 Tax=Enhydrobacter aerosaccus TaxID=225324 RepID=A0A1T4SR78_9HYPH|nr:6-phosphogluconolactonase [Enhydrobacter aerosaccus]SKA30391.1 6-phosphogluconolactonase [Enhydrobacter aerosaccus]
MTGPILDIQSDAEALAAHAADWLIERAASKSGPFAVCLSGGSTPRRLYQLLAAAPRRARFPWERTHWFWGDERFVPHDDPASNYRMVREAMLSHVPVAADHIHPIRTEGMDAAAAAAGYEATLKTFYGTDKLDPGRPLFDVVLLGLGTNGHTASLFPGMRVLQERQRWTGVMTDREAGTRITLTYPALESSREVAFLVAGSDKRTVLEKVLAGDPAQPASAVRPQGTLRFLIDRAAAPADRL